MDADDIYDVDKYINREDRYDWVRCCETTKTYNAIRLDENNEFQLEILIPDAIQYCPWCGKLLDTNLLED
jgi:hypothetical protein